MKKRKKMKKKEREGKGKENETSEKLAGDPGGAKSPASPPPPRPLRSAIENIIQSREAGPSSAAASTLHVNQAAAESISNIAVR